MSHRVLNPSAAVLKSWRSEAAKRRNRKRRLTPRQTKQAYGVYCRSVLSCQPSEATKRSEANKARKVRRGIAMRARMNKTLVQRMVDAVIPKK